MSNRYSGLWAEAVKEFTADIERYKREAAGMIRRWGLTRQRRYIQYVQAAKTQMRKRNVFSRIKGR